MNFKNFLLDVNEYDSAEKYWQTLFEEINSKLPPEKKWEFWFESVSVNGDKLRNGNPILARWRQTEKKALRIIQEEAEFENEFHVGACMDKFDDDIDELVISCVLSNQAENIIQQLIELFVLKNVNPTDMQIEIDNRLERKLEPQ